MGNDWMKPVKFAASRLCPPERKDAREQAGGAGGERGQNSPPQAAQPQPAPLHIVLPPSSVADVANPVPLPLAPASAVAAVSAAMPSAVANASHPVQMPPQQHQPAMPTPVVQAAKPKEPKELSAAEMRALSYARIPLLPKDLCKDIVREAELLNASLSKCHVEFLPDNSGRFQIRRSDDPFHRPSPFGRVQTMNLRQAMITVLTLDFAPHMTKQALHNYAAQVVPYIDELIAQLMGSRKPDSPLTALEALRVLKQVSDLRGYPPAAVEAARKELHRGTGRRATEPAQADTKAPRSQRIARVERLERELGIAGPDDLMGGQMATFLADNANKTARGRLTMRSIQREDQRGEKRAKAGSAVIGGLGMAHGYTVGCDCATGTVRAPVPLATSEAVRLLDTLSKDAELDDVKLGDLFASLQSDPALAAPAGRHAMSLIQRFSTGQSIDHTIGPWQSAASIVLSLPPECLRRMVFTSSMVDMLALEATMSLGWLYKTFKTSDPSVLDDAERSKEWPDALREFARQSLDCPEGQSAANRFGLAIQILRHNADRLDRLIESGETMDHMAGRPLIDVLDAVEPPHYPQSAGLPFAQQLLQFAGVDVAPEESATLHHDEDDHGGGGGSADGYVEGYDSDIETKAFAPASPVERRKTARAQQELKPAETAEPGEGLRQRRGNRQAGAKVTNPAEHFHPRDHRSLKKQEANNRKLKNKLVQEGLLDPYAVWNAQTREAMVKALREQRILRNHGTTEVVGGNVVRQAF